eukprot:gnl/MRDRNA2_/MRDRNA2_94038_c0_seq1.p1 gnl/MRDRNA2_/MRDRNA2_94038_c0~~gnl/MRDRNA2_/MRDRNA2_94038_c0_seq1.p1  ORF type:complete len:790 (-),score=146.46 gnl/MRDRNA2_/MRDRNA2_94038_c0_seq1:208-2493(-)
MPPKKQVNVVWFKCTDLRTHDHAALKAAHAQNLPVLHLYVFDPFWHANKTRICGYPKTGAVRTRFQLEAIADLASRLENKGHRLCTRTGISTAQCFEEICDEYTIANVFAFNEICSEELRVEQQVRKVLQRRGQGTLNLFWGFELHHREDLGFDPYRTKSAYHSYTSFRKRVEGTQIRATSREEPRFLSNELCVRWAREDETLPSVQELMGSTYVAALDPGDKKDSRAELQWQGGETAALARVKQYIWDDDSLGLEYVGATMTMDVSKSCMRDKAMSKLSPWLAHGCLSPRFLYEEVKRYERERKKTKSTYWITHELLWRDFSRYGSMYAGTSIFKIGGPQNGHPTWRWSTDQNWLTAWVEGQTGFPFVDCFMRELKTTGYCNHMGRECCGWFLVGDLGLDWRMGAEWFESVLVDYEPTANWFNWTYRCLPAMNHSGTPGERLRGLEILKWGTQHDPDATYIKRWIPELSSLSPTIAREPWRLGLLDSSDAPSSGRGLRELPQNGKIKVNREALVMLTSMGFNEGDAAMALYRTWEDPDAAVSLLFAEKEGGGSSGQDEEDDLQRAIKLSLGESNQEGSADKPICIDDDESGQKQAGFRYGETYPKPLIQPVSLRNTEEEEEKARQEQSRRDQQIASSKQRFSQSGFNKPAWENSRQQWPAETPTAARWSGKGKSDQREDRSRSGKGHKGYEGNRSKGESTDRNTNGKGSSGSKGGGKKGNSAYSSGREESGRKDAQELGGERKRRWNAKDRMPEDSLQGG